MPTAPWDSIPTATARMLALVRGRAIASAGRDSINSRMQAHRTAIVRTGVGLYYGDKAPFSDYDPAKRAERRFQPGGGMNARQREEWIESHKTPGTNPGMPKESSCIGWAMENVGAAYRAAGSEARWREIEAIVKQAGDRGTVLAQELQKDGWRAIYFNPDVGNPDDGRGEHPSSARDVANGRPYYGIKVDDQVVNYRRTDPREPADSSGVEKLRQVPFFFGVASGGTHTFVGQDGRVSEFHFDRMPNDPNIIEETPLDRFVWNSGVIMVPPGTWPR